MNPRVSLSLVSSLQKYSNRILSLSSLLNDQGYKMVFNFIDDASLVPLPTQVPNLVELSETLGFVTSATRPNRELAESTHCWRRHYVCDDGTPGTELLDWKSSLVRTELKKMTKRYLNGSGYGERWGEHPRPKELQLQYNIDHDKYVNAWWPENPGVRS